jgi:sec-independent protein translocase protein TatC
MAEIDEKRMPFMAHLKELRDRLIRCVLAIGIGMIVCLVFSEKLFHFLAEPLLKVLPEGQKSLQFTGPTDPFLVYLKVGLFGGIVVGMPVIVDQIWKFVTPALYVHERRLAIPLIVSVLVFFVLGMTFAYFVSPYMFGYFVSFQNAYLRVDIRMDEFFDFYIRFLLIFGVAFELPVFVVALASIGVVKASMLSQYRRHVIVGIFVAAAIITPTTDIINQCLMAVPMCLLYELSIFGAKFVQARKQPVPEAADVS